jgi:hypothetical protein
VDTPAINLITALCGLAGAMLIASTFIRPESPARRRWVASAVLVVVVVLGVALPGKLRGDLNALDSQHDAYGSTYEQLAHERCLRDMGREDLQAALAFARERIPDDATYYARTRSQSVACVMLNLFPREPVTRSDFDPARDWLVLDDVDASRLGSTALGERARHSDFAVPGSPSESFLVIPPDGAAG